MEESKILTLDEIKKAEDVKTQEVTIAEWGGKVVLKGITVEEQYKIIEASKEFNEESKTMIVDDMKFELLKIVYGVVEPELSASDLVWLKSKSSIALQKISGVIDFLSCGNELINNEV